jgi:hypothetical protein
MTDSCASVGKIVWKQSAKIHATYDPSTYVTSCMHNVLPEAQAKKLTKNPGVSEAAIKFYYSHAKAVN